MEETVVATASDDQNPTPNNPEPIPTQTSTSSTKKRKTRHHKPHILTQITLRNPQWSYVHLQHLTSSSTTNPSNLDALTAHLHLTSALTQFLGLHGAAVPFDILKLAAQDVWIRIPAEDQGALVAAVGGWVSGAGEGWRVKGWSAWSAGAGGGKGGEDLFAD